MVINTENSFSENLRCMNSSKHGKIAALGMPAKPQRHRMILTDLQCVFQCQPLSGNRVLKAHIEIFFPAGQGVVRTPKGKKSASVVQQECNSCKLGLLFPNQNIPILIDLTIAESRGL